MHAEPIASSMLCAVIFAAGLRFWACTVAIYSLFWLFHYYLVPPITHLPGSMIYSLYVFGGTRLIRFPLHPFVAFMISAQRKATETLGRPR